MSIKANAARKQNLQIGLSNVRLEEMKRPVVSRIVHWKCDTIHIKQIFGICEWGYCRLMKNSAVFNFLRTGMFSQCLSENYTSIHRQFVHITNIALGGRTF